MLLGRAQPGTTPTPEPGSLPPRWRNPQWIQRKVTKVPTYALC